MAEFIIGHENSLGRIILLKKHLKSTLKASESTQNVHEKDIQSTWKVHGKYTESTSKVHGCRLNIFEKLAVDS